MAEQQFPQFRDSTGEFGKPDMIGSPGRFRDLTQSFSQPQVCMRDMGLTTSGGPEQYIRLLDGYGLAKQANNIRKRQAASFNCLRHCGGICQIAPTDQRETFSRIYDFSNGDCDFPD